MRSSTAPCRSLVRSLLPIELGKLGTLGTLGVFGAVGASLAHASSPQEEALDVSAAVEAIRAEAHLPGIVALCVQDGEVAAWGAAGVRVLGGDDPISIDDPMHLGSCTKAMTSTLVAKLIEDGVLTWETTVAEVLPDLAKEIDPGYQGVTIEALLRHRGGIAERKRPELGELYLELGSIEGTPTEVRLKILARVLKTPPLPPAEGGFDYSNYGYMLAGAMLERLTGETWDDLMVEKLFRPLGMTSAGIGSPAGDHVPVGHAGAEDGTFSPMPPGPDGFLHASMGPAGLAHTNLRDWAKFVGEHVRGARGEDGLVSAESFARLQRGDVGGYACGWGIAQHTWSWGEGRVLTHNGSDGTWFSDVFAMPEWDLVVFVATNAPAGDVPMRRVRAAILGELGFLD